VNPSIKRLVFGTFGQTLILVTLALLVAQGIGFFLLVNESDRWQLLGASQSAVDHFAALVREVAHHPQADRDSILMRESGHGRHFALEQQSTISRLKLVRSAELERTLAAALKQESATVKIVEAASAGFSDSPRENDFPRPFWRERLPNDPRRLGDANMPPPPFGADPRAGRGFPFHTGRPPGFEPDEKPQIINLSVQLADGTWVSGQYFSVSPSSRFLSRLALAEIILFAAVLFVTFLVAIRLSRPMRELAVAADRIGPDQAIQPVPERGPLDVRAAIHSFNAMTKRVSDLLREKDQMLGAIGHDLRTPLASLRIRAETVEPPAERQRIIETLEDMQKLLDEILDLARLAYSGEPFARVDLTSLVDAVAEEFNDLGKAVTFVDSPRAVLSLQSQQTKRMVRNLIENAIKFGNTAELRITVENNVSRLLIADNGPGIPDEELERVTEPFVRLEVSRNRETGGAGLGLSIAQAVARRQGADLVLENRKEGGLLVTVRWPRVENP
jgi:signal transduction histidine kinase